MWHINPQSYIVMLTEISLPRSKQLKDLLQHNPVNTKQAKHHCPQLMLQDNEEEGDPWIPHIVCTYNIKDYL